MCNWTERIVKTKQLDYSADSPKFLYQQNASYFSLWQMILSAFKSSAYCPRHPKDQSVHNFWQPTTFKE